MEFNNPFPNRDLEQLTKKMEELRERAGHFSLSVGERLANVREQLQTYSQIAQEKIIQTDHNLTMLAHIHREKIIDGAEFAAAHPVEAGKIVIKKGWIYAAGAGARYALIATGTAMGYMLYPVAAFGTALSSMVVGGYKDWQTMHSKNGARELYNKYVGKDALRAETYDDDQKTGWWNAVKKFTGRYSMSVKEGYRRAYGAYTYKEVINQMVEDTSEENFSKYAERIANATHGEIDYRALHRLQAELRDKLIDASYGVAVAMNNHTRKDGQAVIKKYFSVLQQTAEYTKVDTAEFMSQVAEQKNKRLESSAKKGFAATLLSRGSWSMARFASGGALLGRFTPKAEAHDAIFGNQHQPETPKVQIGHAVREDQYVPKTETAPQPKPSFKTSSVRTDIRSELRAENAAFVHTVPEPKVAAVPRIEMKPIEISVEQNHGLFISLKNSGWGDISDSDSGARFMAEVAPLFRGHGLSEEQYQDLMRVVYENKDITAEDLWKKFKWFDKAFMVHAGKFNINIPQVVDDPTIKVNYDFTAQTVRREGVPKVLFSVLLKDDPPPKPEGGVLHPGGSGLGTNHAEGTVLRPGGRPNIPTTENVPVRPLPDASDRLMDNSPNTTVPERKPNVLHPGGGQPTTPAQSEALRPGQSTINQEDGAANTETLKPGSTVINTPTEARMHPGSTIFKDKPTSSATVTLRPGATTINDQVEQQAAAQPLPAAEIPRAKEFNFNQEFFVSSANKIIEITKENVKRWLHLPLSINELPADPNWDETIVSEYMGRTIIFVHSARKDGMDLPGNFFREAAELGQSSFGYGQDQVQEYLKQAISENRTALFTGQDGSQQTFRLTNAFYQPYREVVQEDLWGNKYDNNLSDLAQYVSQTNKDDVIIVFCGRSHVEAIRKGIEIMQEVKSTLPAEQKDVAETVIITLQNSKATGQSYTNAVQNMFSILKASNPKEYEKLLLLYTGEPYNKDPEALKQANPYMFSGARYVLGLSPVK